MTRCPHCGGRPAVWSIEKVLTACRDWHAKYGAPPAAHQWRSAKPEHPSLSTVRVLFGTWNEMIRQAGFEPRPAHAPPTHWTKEQVVQAFYEWRYTHGHVPSYDDWSLAVPGRPTSHQVQRLFGSWNAGVVAAGYDPEPRGGRGRSRDGYRRQAGATTRNRMVA